MKSTLNRHHYLELWLTLNLETCFGFLVKILEVYHDGLEFHNGDGYPCPIPKTKKLFFLECYNC
jgi:hypothetical protein